MICVRSPTLPSGVFVIFDEPSQAEVSDLAHQIVRHQDVGGAQVSVDVVHPLDVGHARRHLEHSEHSKHFYLRFHFTW